MTTWKVYTHFRVISRQKSNNFAKNTVKILIWYRSVYCTQDYKLSENYCQIGLYIRKSFKLGGLR